MNKLNALVRRVSDTAFIALTLSISGTLIGTWYLWWYTPLNSSIVVLAQEGSRLDRRTQLLAKRLQNSVGVPQELVKLEQERALEAEKLPPKKEALSCLLKKLQNSGVMLLNWQPIHTAEQSFRTDQFVEAHFVGSYAQLCSVLESSFCTTLHLQKTAQGIAASVTLVVPSRRFP